MKTDKKSDLSAMTMHGPARPEASLREELEKTRLDLEVERKLLEDTNIAFRAAMSAVEDEKNKLKDEITANVNELILPLLKRIKMKRGSSRKHLDLLEKSLEALLSPFGSRLTRQNLSLTPKEIEVSNMVKTGMTTKEIAGLLSTSSLTINKHRNNIRRKLGLTNKSINLISFLQSL